MMLHIMQFSPVAYHFLPFRGKYLFTSLSSKHSTFLPQCEQPHFTSIQSNRQNYSYV